MPDDFYKDKFFEELIGRFERLEEDLSCIRKDLAQVKGHLVYIYAFSAGVGFVFYLVWEWLRDKLFTHLT